MDKVRTPEECSALLARQKEYEKRQRTAEFNQSVTKLVELVRDTFVGKSCVVPLKIVYHGHTMDGDPTIATFVERDKEVIKAAVELLREEFINSGWYVEIFADTPIWPFTTKIIVSDVYRCTSRPPKK